jgi:zinc transport system permease protein
MLQYTFIQNALFAGTALAIISAVLGVFVVQKNMSYLGSGLSHSTLGGIGLGVLLGIEPMFIAVPFTIIIALLMTLLTEKLRIENDTTIGIISSAATAFGIACIAISSGYVGDVYSYLFGSILAVSRTDVVSSSVFLILGLVYVVVVWQKLAFATFDSELAISAGINTTLLNLSLSFVLSIAIVLSVKLIGIILIAAFLVLPPAIAKLCTRRFATMTIAAAVVAVVTTICGIGISYYLDFPAGASIIIVQTIVFFIVALFRKSTSK